MGGKPVARISNRYAKRLLYIAEHSGNFENFYTYCVPLSMGIKDLHEGAPDELKEFVDTIPDHELKEIASRFCQLASEGLDIEGIVVVSAVSLLPRHYEKIEKQFVKLLHKRVNIINIVDSSIIGGVRVLVGETAVDNSIKTQLHSMKAQLYEEVYFNEGV